MLIVMSAPYPDAREHHGPGIYAVVSTVTGSAYVGQSLNVAGRVSGHLKHGVRGRTLDQAWLLVAVPEDEWDQDEVGLLEVEWMDKFMDARWRLLNRSLQANPFGGAQVSRRNGRISGKITGPQLNAWLHENDPEHWSRIGGWKLTPKQRSRNGRIAATKLNAWLAEHPEVRSRVQKKAASAAGKINGPARLRELTYEQRSRGGKIWAPKLNATRRRCDECGLTTNPGNMAQHQKRTGHSGYVDLPSEHVEPTTL